MLLLTAYLVWIQMSNIVLVKINFGNWPIWDGAHPGLSSGFCLDQRSV